MKKINSTRSSCFRNFEVHVYHVQKKNHQMKKGPPRPFHRQQKMPKNLMRQKKTSQDITQLALT